MHDLEGLSATQVKCTFILHVSEQGWSTGKGSSQCPDKWEKLLLCCGGSLGGGAASSAKVSSRNLLPAPFLEAQLDN